MLINRFPKLCSALISIIVLSTIISSCKTSKFDVSLNNDNAKVVSAFPNTENVIVKLKTEIKFSDAYITGIVAFKEHGDTTVGAFINEFGIKGFEFEYCKNECKILNVIKPLDKWYIKSTLENDLAFIFARIPVMQDNVADTASCKISKNIKYQCIFYQNKLSKVERFQKDKITGRIDIQSDSLVTMSNLVRNVTYNFIIINYHELQD